VLGCAEGEGGIEVLFTEGVEEEEKSLEEDSCVAEKVADPVEEGVDCPMMIEDCPVLVSIPCLANV